MLRQTRNALIYSDLALFMLDARQGIDGSDVALYKWLTDEKLRIRGVETRLTKHQKEELNVPTHIKQDDDFFNEIVKQGDRDPMEAGKLPGALLLDSRSRKKRRA